MSQSESTTDIIDLRTVGVPVSDQDRALVFSVGVLGLQKRLDVPMGGGRRWIEVAPTRASTTLALVASHEGVPSGVETGIRLMTQDVDANHASLR
jgi:lactoylglutathione lyase